MESDESPQSEAIAALRESVDLLTEAVTGMKLPTPEVKVEVPRQHPPTINVAAAKMPAPTVEVRPIINIPKPDKEPAKTGFEMSFERDNAGKIKSPVRVRFVFD